MPASDAGDSGLGQWQSVTATRTGFLAVGSPLCAFEPDPTTCRAAVWTTAAGEAWSRIPDQPGLVSGLAEGVVLDVFDVAEGPAGVVVIGQERVAPWPADVAAAWRSADGRTWQRVEFRPSTMRVHLAAIAADDRGYVIVGWVDDYGLRGVGAAPEGRAAAWTSPDGVLWTRAADAEVMDVGPCWDALEVAFCGGMHGVAATAGSFVAVGHARTAATWDGNPRPAAWTSPDGHTWARADAGLVFAGSDGFLSGVTAGGPGVVAVGTICQPTCNGSPRDTRNGAGVAASSVDGSNWSIESISGAVSLQDMASTGGIADPDGRAYALGLATAAVEVETEFPPDVLQLWSGSAGGAWQMVQLPWLGDGFALYGDADIAVHSDRLVLVGWISDFLERTPAEVSARGAGSFSYSRAAAP